MDLWLLFLVVGESIRNRLSQGGQFLGQQVGLAVSSEAKDTVNIPSFKLLTILPSQTPSS